MLLTIIGGIIFVGSQAWEWNTFINGTYGAVKTTDGKILQFVDAKGKQIALADFVVVDRGDVREQHTKNNGLWFEEEATIALKHKVLFPYECFCNRNIPLFLCLYQLCHSKANHSYPC